VSPNGQLAWTSPLKADQAACPSIGADGTVYIGSYDKHLYAFAPDGSVKWAFAATSNVDGCAAIDGSGAVHFSAGKTLYALLPDGTMKWSTPAPGASGQGSVSIGGDGSIYVGGSPLQRFSP
jgi:outer membrane protein assembly factor BamB